MEQITTQQLKEKISNKENFILDLFATWCGPCKVMLNTLGRLEEVIASESSETPKYKFYKYDIDSDREFVMEVLEIRSVPTVKIFNEGKETYSKVGIIPSDEIKRLLTK